MEGVVISVVYFALAYVIYLMAIKPLTTTIEEKYFASSDTEIVGTVVAMSFAAFVGLNRLTKV